jgi:hypothetical protein
MHKRALGLGLTAALAVAWSLTAVAQDEPRARPFTGGAAPRGPAAEKQAPYRGETVSGRSRPEYDPLGVRLGGFLLFPQLGLYEAFNDNIFATNDDEKSDFITNIVPVLSLQSDWSRHAIGLAAGANSAKYADFTRQDYTDYFVNFNGRVDITGDSALFLGGGYAERHDLPGDPNAADDVREPTPYNILNGFGRYTQTFGRFRATLDSTIDRFTYEDDVLRDGDRRSNAEDDRTVYAGGVRVGYEVMPDYEAFVRASGNHRSYDKDDNIGIIDRSSTGYSTVAGLALDLGGILFGELYIGYLEQIYESDQFDAISGLDAGGSLTWNVTTLTTITARASRQINDTTQRNVSGILTTSGGLDVDHELLRNLILNANFAVVNDQYESIDRDDDFYIAGLGGRYLFTRNFSGTLGYRFVQRDSSADDLDYTRNVVRIGVQAQL